MFSKKKLSSFMLVTYIFLKYRISFPYLIVLVNLILFDFVTGNFFFNMKSLLLKLFSYIQYRVKF